MTPPRPLKFGARRDNFHTRARELRDFLGSTTFPTSNSERDDIANSAFVRLEKEVFPAGVAFVAFANGERPASNIERTNFAGFNLKKEMNREANIGLTVNRPSWQGIRIDDDILIYQDIRSENVDVHRVGVELDVAKQLTPFSRLFGSMAWIRAQNLTGHGDGPVPLAQTPPLDSRFGVTYQHRTFSATFAGRAVARPTRDRPRVRQFPGYR